MNKQQLAAKIWKSANEMRSKIEASEYKDYILGFVFYKFLSEQEQRYLKKEGATDEEIKEIEEYSDEASSVQRNLGYFIHYNNLFSTWLKMGSDFSVGNVRDALSAFNRLISPTHKKVFDSIFKTLETGLAKLGTDSGSQTKAVKELIKLINDIPMDDKQDYDVLGFIYEYLISNFAANAGKKAGEFYTPHEVSVLMSEIIANHLKDRDEIKIYDPTSGSGSLLINIGQSVAKHINDKNRIKYYAQELKENTYNLTRMNLVMRGILPDNIVTRCGDTLEDDWPYFDDNDKENTYEALTNLDAVVSNPPYSQKWDPTGKKSDPRFNGYGLAPKTKADYAFLLHDLYHLRAGGIMTIVLPHGVLFRGGDEALIRRNLIENNNIDAIIGLPANIFFGTGIPTIIMVLKKNRANDDILIIDASKGFIKEGKNNKLRARDIKKIVDCYESRADIDKFSRKISRDEVRKNDYNLNIPRYVDSSEDADKVDVYATMFGGIPTAEIEHDCNKEFSAFKTLKDELFTASATPYVQTKTESIKETIENSVDVVKFKNEFKHVFDEFDTFLYDILIKNMDTVTIPKTETVIADDIFKRMSGLPLVDEYEAYQILDDNWKTISTDLEMIRTEGKEAIIKVDPNMVIKKKNGKESEVQDGYIGHIIPFNLVQEHLMSDFLNDIRIKKDEINCIQSEYDELIEMLSEEDKQNLLNDDNSAFSETNIKQEVKNVFDEITTPLISKLQDYLKISKKIEKLSFINTHTDIPWNELNSNKDGTYGKKIIDAFIKNEKLNKNFENGSYEYIVLKANELILKEKDLEEKIKKLEDELHTNTKNKIENLTEEEQVELLKLKWITPILVGIENIPGMVISSLTSKVSKLSKKYEETMVDLSDKIESSEKELCAMLDDLTGDEFDIEGLQEFKKLLGGGKND